MSGDWVEGYSKAKEKKFWKNKVTGESRWKDPTGQVDSAAEGTKPAKKAKAVAPSSENETVSDWVVAFSEKKQKNFWKNKVTGESTWEDPTTGASKSATAEESSAATPVPKASKSSKVSSNANSVVENISSAPATDTTMSDWVEKYSEAKKRKYWKNSKTGATSWDNPTTTAKVVPALTTAAHAPETSTVSDWVEKYSEAKKRKYWKNTKTGTTSWDDPAKAAPAPTTTATITTTATEAFVASDWVEKYSEAKKKKFWKNTKTGASSWDDPAKPSKKADEMSVVSGGVFTVATAGHASDWVEAFSTKHNKKYWKNTVTGKTSWSPPGAEQVAPTTTAVSDWVEKYSEAKKRKYWKNTKTGTTSWDDPAKAAPAPSTATIAVTTTATEAFVASDWVEKYSEAKKKKFWKNTKTGASSWDDPAKAASKKADEMSVVSGGAAAVAVGGATSGEGVWIEGFSEKYKRKLWKNTVTGKSSWDPPAGAVTAAPATQAAGTAATSGSVPTPSKASPVLTSGPLKTVGRVAFTSGIILGAAFPAPTPADCSRCLLQLRGHQQATELDVLHFSDECIRSARVEPSTAGGGLSELSTQVLKTFKLAGVQSLVCNEIFGAISLVLPAGCLIYDKTAVDTEKDAAAALLAAGPLSMEEAAAPSTAADAVTATATSTSSTTEAPTATEKETPKKEAEAQCFKVLLCFACPSLAQKWYKLLVHRLALVETSPPTIAAAANSSDASASSAAAPVVCDKTGTELAAPSESEDRLLGAFSLAQADPVLFRLEAQWLGLATDDMVSTAGRTAAAATTGVADLLTLPTSGLLLFKVLVVQESPPDELNNFNGPDDATALARMDSSTSQMKGWMSCWVRLDRAARTLTFFDQGPGSAPSLSVSCDRATLHVPDLTDPELGCECNLYHCTVRNTPIRAKMSLAIKLPSALELFKWVLALSAVLENVTYCSGGKVQPATQPIDYLQDAPYYPAYSMSAALSSSPSDFAATKPYMMEICMGALEALAERKMCSSYIRNVQLSGAQIKTARFLQMNQRIVLLMKGTCSTLTEGSVLLSVNGLSAVSTAASTVLKFIADFPKQMLGELTLWKFPRMEFQVDIVKLAVGAADIEEVKLSMRTNRPSSSSSSSDKTTLDVSVTSAAGGSNSLLASVDDAASQPLDAKGKLNKVIIQKRNSILKFNSGLEMSFEGVAYPSILANIQTELKSLDINNAATAAAAEGGAAGSASWSGSASLLQGAIGQESGGFTLADFTRCSPAEVKWKSCRLMVASGNISLLGTDDTGAEVALGRLQLTSCQLKLVCPTQATHVDHLAVHLRDAKSQVVIRCPSVPVFIDLVECLVISLKMMGAYPADLAHLYDQSVHWKTTQERLSGVSFSSTSSSSALAVSPRGGAASSPQQQSLSSRSASFRSQSLLMQSVVESSEAGGGNASGFLSAPQTPQRTSAATSIYANTDEVPLALTSASSADPDASILQAAEELEDTLSQLHLPLNFPTHTVIEKEMVELFKQNNANHRLLAEFLTLQFEVMNPVPEGTAPASNARSKSFSFSTPTQPSIRAEEEDLDSAETKYPNMNPAAAGGAVGDDAGAEESGEGANLKDFPSSADMALRDKLVAALSGGDDDNGGSGSNGDSEKANTKESAATVSNSTADQPDRSEEAPETFKVVSPPSPKESGGTPPVVRRASVQMRSGSVMMGSAAPVTVVQSSANRRATFRKSAITHSQEQAAVLLMSQLEKQVLLQSVLSKGDRSAISVLLNHLRNSAQDLVNIATRFTSPTDVTGLAHFVVHRLCVYWSAEQQQLEEILHAAAAAEAPHHARSFADAMAGASSSSGGASGSKGGGGTGTGGRLSAGVAAARTGGLLFTANNSLLTRLSGPANASGGSFLQALLHEISTRLDVVVYVQSLCEGISVESLTQDSGVADLCARVVEPFCRRFEAAVVSGTMPIVLKFALRALVRCEATPIKPLDFIADCILPHILSTILARNKVAEETVGSALGAEQVQIILDRVRDMVNLCFNQDVARHLKICLSDQAALSRSKWFIERSMQYIVQDSTAATTSSASHIAKLAQITSSSGKTSAIQGLICVRPSELFFILQSMELSNISAAPLSAYSKELSQAITHMHTSDLLQRLHAELRLTPATPIGTSSASTATAAAASSGGGGTGILDAMRDAGVPHLDRELTFLLHIAPHCTYHNEFMHHFNDDSAVPAVNIPLPRGISSGGAGSSGGGSGGSGSGAHHSGSHAGAGTASFNSTSTSSSDFDLSALISSESVEESQEAHSLASIRWLVQAARSALKSMYEHNNSSVVRNQSTVRELQELRAKLQARQGEIGSILADWKKISLCMELCSNFKAQISLLLEKYKHIKKISQQSAQSMVFWNSSGMTSSGNNAGSGSGNSGSGSGGANNESAPSTVALLEASAQLAAATAAKEAEVQNALAKIVMLQLKLEGELQHSHHAAAARALPEADLPPPGLRSASKLAALAASSLLNRTPVGANYNHSRNRTPGSSFTSPQGSISSESRGGRMLAGGVEDFSPAGALRTRAPNPLHVVMQSVYASSQAAALRK